MTETFTTEQKLAAYTATLKGIAAGDGDEPSSEEQAQAVLAMYGDDKEPVTTERAMDLAGQIKAQSNAIENFIEGIPDDLFASAMEDGDTVKVSSLTEARDLVTGLLDDVVELAEALGIPTTIYSEEDRVQVWYTVGKVTSSSPNSAPVIEIGDVACSSS